MINFGHNQNLMVDPAKLLSYGAIGLGFLLAFMAYLLLSGEQKRAQPRQSIIRAIYSFMIFAFALAFLGFANEFAKNYSVNQGDSSRYNFSQSKINLLSPPNHSTHDDYPRSLNLTWELAKEAKSYRVEWEILVPHSDNSIHWEPLDPVRAYDNHAQIEFNGASDGRWRVIAINQYNDENLPSDWWYFKFSQ
jgi:hypothetical protein